MNPKHCVSLELSKKLKEVGYKQEGAFWWNITKEGYYCEGENPVEFQFIAKKHKILEGKTYKLIVTPIASELMERLPCFIVDYQLVVRKLHNGWRVSYGENVKDEIEYFTDDALCNALAKMYIYLAENKLLKGDK